MSTQGGEFLLIDTVAGAVIGQPIEVGGNLVSIAVPRNVVFGDGFDVHDDP
ncbi:MAG TPA: hypothetical protein VFS55_03640 [Dokdonella sp.]|nr:hypothetical protein [Dokdonella sp.]